MGYARPQKRTSDRGLDANLRHAHERLGALSDRPLVQTVCGHIPKGALYNYFVAVRWRAAYASQTLRVYITMGDTAHSQPSAAVHFRVQNKTTGQVLTRQNVDGDFRAGGYEATIVLSAEAGDILAVEVTQDPYREMQVTAEAVAPEGA